MPSPRAALALRSLLVLLAAWLCTAALAAAPARDAPVLLSDGLGLLRADALAQAWLDPTGMALVDEVAQGPDRFAPTVADAIYPLGPGSALWLRLRLQRAEGERLHWLVVVPNPLVDQATAWQRDERGRWKGLSAGDTLAVERWPEAGRYPAFRLELPAGQAREVYLQLRSAIPTAVPLRLASDSAHTHQLQLEYLGLGAAYGALLLLIAACLAQSWAFSDKVYGWYALYAALSTLSLMAYTGVAAHLLWPWSGLLADAAPGCLSMLAAGAAILFVRRLTGIAARHARLDRSAFLLGWGGTPLAIAYLLLDRRAALDLLALYLLAATTLNMLVAGLAWRRRDRVGLWVLLANLPLTLAVGTAILRLFGILPVAFATQYAVVLAIVAEVPLLLVALSLRSRDRRGAEIREQALSSHDALTGLLAPHIFRDRLQQVTQRYKRHQEDAAVVFIDLVNYGRIKAVHGSAVAEQSLLRSVIKLRRVLRDVDTVGRVGEARFGLILEGVTSRTSVTDRAARLIAAGLMPLQGLKPDVTLQFHVAAVLLRERMAEPQEIEAALDALMGSMSPRTRRPIRFLKPEDTQRMPLETDSELPGDPLPAAR
ncbi:MULTISPECIES: sensor domain-containing diguanylate cyclase [Ramlibacter]|nr:MULTISPECIES: 7TM diverse intracellular signaling domain-containing protein [Ramlibacter]MBA2965261.1 diguanylate cyclase [Ramlibacter sp. CGMCC 1.13660]